MIQTIMESGSCVECGAKERNGLSCSEQFGYLLAWEHNDPELYALHFWTVGNYMIQHPSNYTNEGNELLRQLFCDAYDYKWSTNDILKKNREATTNKSFKITNPTPFLERKRVLREWSMTMSDVYGAGEMQAIEQVKKWSERVRAGLSQSSLGSKP